jgi:hypothetical protein
VHSTGRRKEGKAHTSALGSAVVPQWSLLWQGIQIQLSHVDTVAEDARQRPVRFHARRRAPPLHSLRQGFENAGACFWPKRWSQTFAFVTEFPVLIWPCPPSQENCLPEKCSLLRILRSKILCLKLFAKCSGRTHLGLVPLFSQSDAKLQLLWSRLIKACCLHTGRCAEDSGACSA